MNRIIQFFNRIVEKIRLMQNSRKILLVSACVFVIAVLVILSFSWPKKQKYVFFFPLSESPSVTKSEIRYLPVQKDLNTAFNGFISELLLGPFTHEFSPLFNSSFRVSQAFIGNKNAYVNITSENIELEEDVVGYERSWELFKKNVCTNYKSIGKIYLYINGIEVYCENPVDDAVIIK